MKNPLVQQFEELSAPNPLTTVLGTDGDAGPAAVEMPSRSDFDAFWAQALEQLQTHHSALLAQLSRADRQAVRTAIADVVLSLHPPQDLAIRLTESLEAQLLGAGALEPFMRDPTVTEIMVTGPYVYVERDGRLHPALTLRSMDESIKLAQHLARHCRQEYRESEPLLNLTWPENGARINMTHHRIAPTGPAITIRKHNFGALMQLSELVARRMLPEAMATFLADALHHKANVLIAGSPGSGKTSLMRALIMESVRPDERLIVLEDTEELRLPHRHQVNLIGEPRGITADERRHGLVSVLDLFRNGLRQRPDRMIMGELRGPEVFDFIEMGLTESVGSISTIHLRHPSYLVTRLHYIAQKEGLGWTRETIQISVYQAIDLIVQVSHNKDTGFRWVSEVVEPVPDGNVRTLWTWNGKHATQPAEPSAKLEALWAADQEAAP